MTDPSNIMFDDFGIWLLGYMVEFSCLYITQCHYVFAMKYRLFSPKSIFKATLQFPTTVLDNNKTYRSY